MAWAIFFLNIVILSFTLCLSLSLSLYLASRLNPELSNHLPNFSLKRTLKFPPLLCASHPCHMILLFSSDLLRQTSLKNGLHMRTQTCSLPAACHPFLSLGLFDCTGSLPVNSPSARMNTWRQPRQYFKAIMITKSSGDIRHWIMPLMCLIFKTKVG